VAAPRQLLERDFREPTLQVQGVPGLTRTKGPDSQRGGSTGAWMSNPVVGWPRRASPRYAPGRRPGRPQTRVRSQLPAGPAPDAGRLGVPGQQATEMPPTFAHMAPTWPKPKQAEANRRPSSGSPSSAALHSSAARMLPSSVLRLSIHATWSGHHSSGWACSASSAKNTACRRWTAPAPPHWTSRSLGVPAHRLQQAITHASV
jgi:hypothetical protein